jgi:hypothetical protein
VGQPFPAASPARTLCAAPVAGLCPYGVRCVASAPLRVLHRGGGLPFTGHLAPRALRGMPPLPHLHGCVSSCAFEAQVAIPVLLYSTRVACASQQSLAAFDVETVNRESSLGNC